MANDRVQIDVVQPTSTDPVFRSPLDLDLAALRSGTTTMVKTGADGRLYPVTIELDEDTLAALHADLAEWENEDRGAARPRPSSALSNVRDSSYAPGLSPQKGLPTSDAKRSQPRSPRGRPGDSDKAVPPSVFAQELVDFHTQRKPTKSEHLARTRHSHRQLKTVEIQVGKRQFQPAAISRFSCVEYGTSAGGCIHRLLIFGGRSGTSPHERELYELQLANHCWRRIETTGYVPFGRHSHSAVLYGDEGQERMLVWGGIGAGGVVPAKPSTKKEEDASKLARYTAFFPPPKAGSRAHVATGGDMAAALQGDILLGDSSAAHGTPSTASAIRGLSGIALNATRPIGFLNQAYELNVEKHSWRLLSTAGADAAIAGHTMVRVSDDTAIQFGGVLSDFSVSDRVIAVDLPKRSHHHNGELAFRRLQCGGATFPCARHSHSAVLYGRWMIIHGGRDEDETTLSDTWALNIETRTWQQLEIGNATDDGLPARMGHCSVVVDHRLLHIGGAGDDLSQYVEGIHEVNLVPQNGQIVCRKVSTTDGDGVPRCAFGGAATGGDAASIVVFGGYGRPPKAKKPAPVNPEDAAHAKEGKDDKPTKLSDAEAKREATFRQPAPRNWSFLCSYPLSKAKTQAAADGLSAQSPSHDGSTMVRGPTIKEPTEAFLKCINKCLDFEKETNMLLEAAQRKETLAAMENSGFRMRLPDQVARNIHALFNAAIKAWDACPADSIAKNVPDHNLRVKLLEDGQSSMKKARESVEKVIGHPKKVLRLAKIKADVDVAKNSVRETSILNNRWPKSSITDWFVGHKQYWANVREHMAALDKAFADHINSLIETRVKKLAVTAVLEKEHNLMVASRKSDKTYRDLLKRTTPKWQWDQLQQRRSEQIKKREQAEEKAIQKMLKIGGRAAEEARARQMAAKKRRRKKRKFVIVNQLSAEANAAGQNQQQQAHQPTYLDQGAKLEKLQKELAPFMGSQPRRKRPAAATAAPPPPVIREESTTERLDFARMHLAIRQRLEEVHTLLQKNLSGIPDKANDLTLCLQWIQHTDTALTEWEESPVKLDSSKLAPLEAFEKSAEGLRTNVRGLVPPDLFRPTWEAADKFLVSAKAVRQYINICRLALPPVELQCQQSATTAEGGQPPKMQQTIVPLGLGSQQPPLATPVQTLQQPNNKQQATSQPPQPSQSAHAAPKPSESKAYRVATKSQQHQDASVFTFKPKINPPPKHSSLPHRSVYARQHLDVPRKIAQGTVVPLASPAPTEYHAFSFKPPTAASASSAELPQSSANSGCISTAAQIPPPPASSTAAVPMVANAFVSEELRRATLSLVHQPSATTFAHTAASLLPPPLSSHPSTTMGAAAQFAQPSSVVAAAPQYGGAAAPVPPRLIDDEPLQRQQQPIQPAHQHHHQFNASDLVHSLNVVASSQQQQRVERHTGGEATAAASPPSRKSSGEDPAPLGVGPGPSSSHQSAEVAAAVMREERSAPHSLHVGEGRLPPPDHILNPDRMPKLPNPEESRGADGANPIIHFPAATSGPHSASGVAPPTTDARTMEQIAAMSYPHYHHFHPKIEGEKFTSDDEPLKRVHALVDEHHLPYPAVVRPGSFALASELAPKPLRQSQPLFKAAKKLTPGQRRILEARQSNLKW